MGKICFDCATADGAAAAELWEGHGTTAMSGAIMPFDSSGRAGCVEVGGDEVLVAAACAGGWDTGIIEAYGC